MLDQQMGVGAVGDRIEAADYHRVRERGEHLGLALQILNRIGVFDQVGANDLRNQDRVAMLVPDQVDLVEVATADRLEHAAPRHDLVSIVELPGGIAHRQMVPAAG